MPQNLSRFSKPVVLLLSLFLFTACGGDDDAALVINNDEDPDNSANNNTNNNANNNEQTEECEGHEECSGDTPWCSSDSVCEALPAGHQIGLGDGTPESVEFVQVYEPERSIMATDLDFDPDHPTPENTKLWVLRREHDSDQPCEENDATAAGCAALEGSVAIIWDVGTNDQHLEHRTDGNAWHFMRLPMALAFGDNEMFATVGEARTGNYLDDPNDYMGPSLWSTDLEIFAENPGPGLNGSHMDMLHHAPFSMGVAHEVDFVYWVFNGHLGTLDRSDFVEDHGPGESYHGNAHVHRHMRGELQREPGVPSHMELHEESRTLFIADTGNQRIVEVDIDSGSDAGPISEPNFDGLSVWTEMENTDFGDFVAPGTLDKPSGLALHDDVLFVTDNETGEIHAFDLDGELLRSLDTGFPAGSLAGLTVGPDDHVYFVDMPNGTVHRIDVTF